MDTARNIHRRITRESAVVSTCRRTPILRSHASRFYERRIFSVTFTSAHLYGNVYILVGLAHALADWSDLGLLEEQSLQNFVITCHGRR